MHPSTKWYQDLSNLYLTITEPDLQDIKHKFQEQKLLFSASKKNEDKYEMTLNFALPINVEKSAIKLNGNQINIIVNKLEPQWWTYLVTEKKLKLENYKSENIKSENKHILNVIMKNPRLVKRRDALWNIFEIK